MEIEGKNVLITGGAGFIGSHLVDEYLEQNVGKVVVFDDLSTGFAENLEHVKKDSRLKMVKGSILNRRLLEETVRKENIEIIDHQAAELEVYTGIRNSQKDARINILGTLNVLNTALKLEVKKVLFASSGAVYGEAEYTPVDEGHPLTPHWPYGVSKLSAERYCIQYFRLYGLNVTAFRYAIVYGPREWFGRVLTMFIKRIFLENKPPVVFGDGTQTRDYIYVKDLTKAHMLALQNDNSAGEVFNISSGKAVSIKELAETLIQISGKQLDIIFDNPPEGKASRYQPERIRLQGELKRFVLSPKKAEKLLGWKPHTPFKEGVTKEIEWVLANKERWNTKPRV
ncbi:UDP-glucose 4-epimerase [Candidatus Bathyarchaeota archaeon]|nr:MAG: UDP-glucose 4-epimerase [Candidatus Bathyarchaeota archaeon]